MALFVLGYIHHKNHSFAYNKEESKRLGYALRHYLIFRRTPQNLNLLSLESLISFGIRVQAELILSSLP